MYQSAFGAKGRGVLSGIMVQRTIVRLAAAINCQDNPRRGRRWRIRGYPGDPRRVCGHSLAEIRLARQCATAAGAMARTR
jgi:hypothetical protein